MNTKAVIPLGLAGVLGLTAAVLVRSTLSHKGGIAVGPSNLVTVVVAKQDAEPGHTLAAEDLAVAKVPADAAPGQVFSTPDPLVGRVVTTQLVKGQTILETLLAPTGSGGGLQALIPAGMRAVTVEVNEFSGVAGMIDPGSRVDLISVINDLQTHASTARTVLQNVKVQAVGRNITPPHPVAGEPPAPPSSSVTLLCTPKQAQTLELACQQSRPWLALRGGRDQQETVLDGTTLAELSGTHGPDATGLATAGPADATPAQPTELAAPPADAPPATVHKTVTLILNGVESQVVVTVPNPQATVGTDTGDAFPPAR